MTDQSPTPHQPRPTVGVHFKCCNVYVNIYQNHTGTAYAGHCPRCTARIEIPIVKQGGSASRFFTGS